MSRSDVLVDADWVEAHNGEDGLVLVEVDEDTAAYDKGHIRNAVKIDWKKDLQDPVRRDFVDKDGFAALLSARGISNDDTVVLDTTESVASVWVKPDESVIAEAQKRLEEWTLGRAQEEANVAAPPAGQSYVSATATDPDGNTSVFTIDPALNPNSNCIGKDASNAIA